MIKLSDVCEFIVDCPHSTAQDEGIGYPLIRTPNVGKGRLILEGVHRVSKEIYDKCNQRAIPQDDDLIFAREAPAGNVAVIKNGEKVCLGQRTVLLRPNKNLANSDFLTYYLLAPPQQYSLLGTANGATVAHVNIPTIRELTIELPPLDVQAKIAGVLSAYDNLIENNQKQIKLLEEAAQRIYKKWFVLENVPDGWRKTNVNEMLTFHRGYDLTKTNMGDGPYPVVGSTSILGYHKTYKIQGPGIVTGRSGSLGQYQLIWENYWPHNTSLYISDFKGHNIFYIFNLLQTLDFSALNNGGAIPTLNRNVLSNIEVFEPDKDLQEKYAASGRAFLSKNQDYKCSKRKTRRSP